MTEADDDDSEIEQRRLCADCIGEAFLRSEIEQVGERGSRHYCGEEGLTASIGEIADYIDTAFEQHFQRTATEPTSLEYAMIGHTQVQTTARYAHLANDPVKTAAGRVSDMIGAAMLGRKPSAKRRARSRSGAAGESPKRAAPEAEQRVPSE